jgi:Fur family ferric uptake transcriptional regulator
MSTSWSDALRSAGLRVTRPRLTVADALAELGGHHSADEILEHLEAAGRPLPRASVYNVLDALVAAGIAVPAYHGPGRALYELRGEDHDHFYCTACDTISDVDRTTCLTDHGRAEPAQAAVLTDVAVVYRGLCGACA